MEGVKVKGSVNGYNNAYLVERNKDQKEQEWTAITDKNGIFTVHGIKGISLDIKSLEKDGYWSPSREEYFELSEMRFGKEHLHKPQLDKPVVSQMWKKRLEANYANLVERRMEINLGADGGELRFDLISGKQIEDKNVPANLVITFLSPSIRQKRRDWAMELSVPDGGIMSTEELYPYMAPNDGYKSSVFVKTGKGDDKWRSTNYRFYIKGNNGKFYAVIELKIRFFENDGVRVGIYSRCNADGSTDLVPKPPKGF